MGRCCLCQSQPKSGISFFTFPRKRTLRKKWIEFVKMVNKSFNTKAKNSRICSKHFAETEITYNELRRQATFLVPNPVPSIHVYSPTNTAVVADVESPGRAIDNTLQPLKTCQRTKEANVPVSSDNNNDQSVELKTLIERSQQARTDALIEIDAPGDKASLVSEHVQLLDHPLAVASSPQSGAHSFLTDKLMVCSPLKEQLLDDSGSIFIKDDSIKQENLPQLCEQTQSHIAQLKAQHAKEMADLNAKLREAKKRTFTLLVYNRLKEEQLQQAQTKINFLQNDLLLSEKILESNGIIVRVEDTSTSSKTTSISSSEPTNVEFSDEDEMESLEWIP